MDIQQPPYAYKKFTAESVNEFRKLVKIWQSIWP